MPTCDAHQSFPRQKGPSYCTEAFFDFMTLLNVVGKLSMLTVIIISNTKPCSSNTSAPNALFKYFRSLPLIQNNIVLNGTCLVFVLALAWGRSHPCSIMLYNQSRRIFFLTVLVISLWLGHVWFVHLFDSVSYSLVVRMPGQGRAPCIRRVGERGE